MRHIRTKHGFDSHSLGLQYKPLQGNNNEMEHNANDTLQGGGGVQEISPASEKNGQIL